MASDTWHRRWVGVRLETAPRQERPWGELGWAETLTSEAEAPEGDMEQGEGR